MSKFMVNVDVIQDKIYVIRGENVMLDRDLASLYGVETRVLNQAIRRNQERFPEDFMFSLTRQEIMNLSQIVISSKIKHAPNVYVFTEQGVAMLSTVLRSRRAILVNIQIIRVFVKLRKILSQHKDLLEKLNALERKFQKHDYQIIAIFEAMRRLVKEEKKPKTPFGFQPTNSPLTP